MYWSKSLTKECSNVPLRSSAVFYAWLRRWLTLVGFGIASAVARSPEKTGGRRICSMAIWLPRMEIEFHFYRHHASFYRHFQAERSATLDCFSWMSGVLWISVWHLKDWISADVLQNVCRFVVRIVESLIMIFLCVWDIGAHLGSCF